MPTVAEEDTRTVSGKELADMLNRAPGTISRGAKRKYFVQEKYPVFEWAEWHPAGNIVRQYHVPVQVLKEKLPQSEWSKHGIYPDTE